MKTIPKGAYLGITHVAMGTTVIRTPLGGFINHSEEPNCELNDSIQFGGSRMLVSLREISPGEEITLAYKMYDPTE